MLEGVSTPGALHQLAVLPTTTTKPTERPFDYFMTSTAGRHRPHLGARPSGWADPHATALVLSSDCFDTNACQGLSLLIALRNAVAAAA